MNWRSDLLAVALLAVCGINLYLITQNCLWFLARIREAKRARRCSICRQNFEDGEVLVRVPPDSKYAGTAHWRCFHAYGEELGLDFVFDPWRGVRLRERKE